MRGLDDTQEEDSLSEVLRRLPLLDELFLGMQAMNIDLVDDYLEGQEAQLRKRCTEFCTDLSALHRTWTYRSGPEGPLL